MMIFLIVPYRKVGKMTIVAKSWQRPKLLLMTLHEMVVVTTFQVVVVNTCPISLQKLGGVWEFINISIRETTAVDKPLAKVWQQKDACACNIAKIHSKRLTNNYIGFGTIADMASIVLISDK